MLSQLVDAGKLGGWVRAGVAAALPAIVHAYPPLGDVLTQDTQVAIAGAVSMVAVGAWSHFVKS